MKRSQKRNQRLALALSLFLVLTMICGLVASLTPARRSPTIAAPTRFVEATVVPQDESSSEADGQVVPATLGSPTRQTSN